MSDNDTAPTTEWAERTPLGPHGGNDVGGEVQIGEGYSRSWIKRTPDMPGRWSMITSYHYVCKDKGELFIEHKVEWLVCTDWQDPGGTEIWSTYRDDELSDSRTPTDALAFEFSTGETDELLDWDGLPVYGNESA